MDVGTFMGLALGHPKLGYYITRDPLGANGDFTTSPEISQTFGEMLAVCVAEAWVRGGQMDAHLVELGPGRGTLMADILRCCKNAPQFHERVQVHMVETSPVLRAAQKEALRGHSAAWHESIDTLPKDAPLIIIANEFFDALPIRQAVMTARGWHERVVALEGEDFVFGARPLPGVSLPVKPEGTILEFSPVRDAVMQGLCARLKAQGGMMLALDYGHAVPDAAGDTFQAVRRHQYVSPLTHVGEADLTSHVDFARLAKIARDAGCMVLGPVTQKTYLENMGIQTRLQALMGVNPGNTALPAGVARLTDAQGMGGLFKVIGIVGALTYCLLQPAGFDNPS